MTFRCALLVPTYDNPKTVRAVVEHGRRFLSDVVVVDDGSASPGRSACEALARDGLAHVHHRERNGGKGAAVKSGFAVARELGFTHVMQVDADGQHDLDQIPAFVGVAQEHPEAFVMAYPEYDDTVPRSRLVGREITKFWVDLEVGRGVIRDAMVGFRVYPLAALDGLPVVGDRMDFDIEVAVRLAWAGVPIINRPVHVRYLSEDEGGVSHFQPLWDNVRFSWLHAKLCTRLWVGRVFGYTRKPQPELPA